jgi:hypothetical protein
MLQQKAKEVADTLGKTDFKHLTDGWKVSEKDILLFSVVSVENLWMFVKKP